MKSPPFPYTLPANNNLYQYLGIDVSGTVAPAAGDGYFSSIPGGTFSAQHYYLLHFGGRLPISPTNFFYEDITYRIAVTP